MSSWDFWIYGYLQLKSLILLKIITAPIFDNIATDPTIFGAGLFTFTLPTSSSMQMLKSHIGTANINDPEGIINASLWSVLSR